MKKVNPVIIVFLLSMTAIFSQKLNLRMMTYNIRYASNNPGEEWDMRKDKVAEMIRFHNPDIFGVQEALQIQIDFLKDQFQDYQQIGIARDDGKQEGEYSALFISNKFDIDTSGTFWISETPDTPSFGWDAVCRRIATWAKIIDKKSKDSLFVINTHLDHKGITARKKGVELLMDIIQNLSNGLPIILSGDFNFTKDFEGYQYIENLGLLKDSEILAEYKYGTDISFNGFQDNMPDKEKIDFIFVSKQFKVYQHAVIGDKIKGKYPSDHMPVIVDLELN